mmetsp:Transcript_24552/g.40649  ORF Transcript_24552/g.40649 Transcript_24552/m.40649 type:complete len:110 (+) Transcript_24552:84-413(+)
MTAMMNAGKHKQQKKKNRRKKKAATLCASSSSQRVLFCYSGGNNTTSPRGFCYFGRACSTLRLLSPAAIDLDFPFADVGNLTAETASKRLARQRRDEMQREKHPHKNDP